jgi:hypothetical protein
VSNKYRQELVIICQNLMDDWVTLYEIIKIKMRERTIKMHGNKLSFGMNLINNI